MKDPKVIEWIERQRKKGHNDEKIRQAMLKHGYEDIDAYFEESFNDLLLRHGQLFQIFFYLMMAYFFIAMAGLMLSSIIKFNFGSIIAIFLMYILFHTLGRKDLYESALIMSLTYMISIMGLSVLQTLLEVPVFVFYLLFAAIAGVSGFVIAYVFNTLKINDNLYLIAGLLLSSIASIIFAVNMMISYLTKEINAIVEALSINQGIEMVFNSSFPNPHIIFSLSMLLFNLPWFYFRQGHYTKLFMYLFPAIFYLLMTVVLVSVADTILTFANFLA